MSRRPVAVALSLALALPVAFLASPVASAAPVVIPAKPYDFDGDGFPELAVGSQRLQIRDEVLAGGVLVLPASRSGLSLAASLVSQDLAGLGGAQAEATFGGAVASADFNKDGYADLAVGASSAPVGGFETSGEVDVVYGSAQGLTGSGSTVLRQADGSQFDVGFGTALVSADFDGDGWPDLAASAPRAGYEATPRSDGSVSVFAGGPNGFSAQRATVLKGDSSTLRYDTGFGQVLAVGDVDANGRPDLVVGSDGEAYGPGYGSPGSLSACYGRAQGFDGCTQLVRDSALSGLTALVVGDITGSTRPEVVAGVPEGPEGGAVQVVSLPEGQAGLVLTRVTQDYPGVPGTAESGDYFGDSLAVGDLDADGVGDLVVGAPGEAVGSTKTAGRVTVLYGERGGYVFRTKDNLIYDRATKGVPGSAGKGDAFGDAVSLGDHDGDGHLDLTVGAPYDDKSGAVTILPGAGTSFTTKGARTTTLKALGYPTPKNAHLGEALGG